MRRKLVLVLLLIAVLGIVLAGNAAHADRQCYQPYFYLYGERYQTRVCVPCMDGVCLYLPKPVVGGGTLPAGLGIGIGR